MIGEYDKTEAFIAMIKILEIKGENKLINQVQNDCIKAFKVEYGESSLNIEWLIQVVLKARKEAIQEHG